MVSCVWIVIVNYRTADLTINCLNSIAGQAVAIPGLRCVVVDNASGDGSIEKLQRAIGLEGWDRWVSLLSLDRNGGFAFGNNAGIKEALRTHSHAHYVMLLNPDTIVHERGIQALIDFMDSNQRVGIAGSRLENSKGSIERSAHRPISPLTELASGARLGILSRALNSHTGTSPSDEASRECDWVSGASLIIRRKVFDDIGLLDEGYFLYFEELDFCLRARKAGWKVWYVPESRITHFEGAATGIRDVARRRPQYWYESRRRYFVKHFGMRGLVLADILWAIGRVSLALRRALRLGSGGSRQDPKRFAFDLLWGDFRSLVGGDLWKNL